MPHHALRCGAYAVELRSLSALAPQSMGAASRAQPLLWHFTMSLDGFVAGPNHEVDWMTGISFRPGLEEQYVETNVFAYQTRMRATPDASAVIGPAG
jgi:hypothetical protein